MSVAEATPDHIDEVAHKDDRAFLGHPKGLGYLGFVEGCEWTCTGFAPVT